MNKIELTKEESELGVRSLDITIATMKAELDKLQKARDFLAGQNGLKPSGSAKGRLPKGLPQKLVSEVMKKYKRLTIGEIRQKVKEDRDYQLRDSSARRGLRNLIKQEVVWLDEDGYYNYKEPTSPNTDAIYELIDEVKNETIP
ncbi:MAG: hypothetical protein IIC66_13515 [candidate division Zixibacteria bacterium]|nr:hypothetical protein [candidate division Zixibacteria bacterium]